MNDFKIGIKDRYPLIDFALYGSRARRNMRPNVLIGDYCALPLFKDGDILDANAIFNLIKCTRWKEWLSVEKIDEHVANDVIHVTQEDKDKWNNYELIQSDWNESDEESYAFIKNKPILSTVAISGLYADLLNKPFIPAALADLQDDSTHRVVTDDQISTWNSKSDFSGSYNDLTDKPTIPTIPTNVSAFTNDAGYLTSVGYGDVGYTVSTDSVSGAVAVSGTTPLHVLTVTDVITSFTLSTNPLSGHSCHIIFTTSSTDKAVTILYNATNSITPDGNDIVLAVPAGGYVEVDFLNTGSGVFVKAS